MVYMTNHIQNNLLSVQVHIQVYDKSYPEHGIAFSVQVHIQVLARVIKDAQECKSSPPTLFQVGIPW